MKRIHFYSLVLVAILMASCNKTENQATGVGDAIIIAKQSGTNTVYGISLYAYTFSSFLSVKAVNSAETGKTYSLKPNQGYKTNFYYETPDAEFTTTKPVASTFNFSAVFENGVAQEFQDVLSDKVLPVPVLEKCAYNATTHFLEVEWTLLSDADSYAINILDGSTLVFGSTELAKTIKSYSISASGGGWANGFSPVSGKTYIVKILAFLYEPEGGSYNMQASSVAEKTVDWGN